MRKSFPLPLAASQPANLKTSTKRDWTDPSTYPSDEDELIDAYLDHCPGRLRTFESAAQLFLGFGATEDRTITIAGYTERQRPRTISLTEDEVAIWFDLTYPRKLHLQWLGDELKRPKANETERQRKGRHTNHRMTRKALKGLEDDVIEYVNADRIRSEDINRKSIKDILRELYEAHYVDLWQKGLVASPVAPKRHLRTAIPEFFGRRDGQPGVLLVFDLTRTLNTQWKDMKIRLATYQKRAGIKAPDTRMRKDMLQQYLRVLDARAMAPPVPYSKIGRILLGPSYQDNAGARAKQLHNAAKAMGARLYR